MLPVKEPSRAPKAATWQDQVLTSLRWELAEVGSSGFLRAGPGC